MKKLYTVILLTVAALPVWSDSLFSSAVEEDGTLISDKKARYEVGDIIVVLVREGADPADSAWRGWLKKDLTVSLAGVDADAAHVLWIPATEENGRTLLVRGFKPGTADRTVVLIPGKTITVRLKAPGTFRLAEVAVLGPGDEVLPAVPSEAGDGAYLVRGLADGTWKVKAKARGADAWLYGTADVEAGSTAEITLAPK